MPVILGSKESTDTWLSSSDSSFKRVMKPYEESDLVCVLQNVEAVITVFFMSLRFSGLVSLHLVLLVSPFVFSSPGMVPSDTCYGEGIV